LYWYGFAAGLVNLPITKCPPEYTHCVRTHTRVQLICFIVWNIPSGDIEVHHPLVCRIVWPQEEEEEEEEEED
jgi:hypothetical protein